MASRKPKKKASQRKRRSSPADAASEGLKRTGAVKTPDAAGTAAVSASAKADARAVSKSAAPKDDAKSKSKSKAKASSGSGVKSSARGASRAAAKAKRARKPNLLTRLLKYIGSIRTEMRRVTWPTKKELINYSVAVCASLVVIGIVIALLDAVIGQGLVHFSGLRAFISGSRG